MVEPHGVWYDKFLNTILWEVRPIDNETSKRLQKSTCCNKECTFHRGRGDDVGKCNGGSCLKLVSSMYKIAFEVIYYEC